MEGWVLEGLRGDVMEVVWGKRREECGDVVFERIVQVEEACGRDILEVQVLESLPRCRRHGSGGLLEALKFPREQDQEKYIVYDSMLS